MQLPKLEHVYSEFQAGLVFARMAWETKMKDIEPKLAEFLQVRTFVDAILSVRTCCDWLDASMHACRVYVDVCLYVCMHAVCTYVAALVSVASPSSH